MFKWWFFLEWNRGNNALSYDKKGDNPRLFIPSLIDAQISDIELGDKPVFEDYDIYSWKMTKFCWLENYYRIGLKNWKEAILVDNHNMVLYFWYEAFKQWKITEKSDLIHIDEHSDMKDDWLFFKNINDEFTLVEAFDFTVFDTNVWNYIKPAISSNLVWEVFQIRSDFSLDEYMNYDFWKNYILNVDLDFWQENLDFIWNDKKNKFTKKLIENAWVITVATSPLFIDQNRAIEVFKELFSEFEK